MSLFSRLSILMKFVVAFSVVLLITAGLGVFALTQIDSVVTVADGLEANIYGTAPIVAMGRSGLLLFGYASEAALLAAKPDTVFRRPEEIMEYVAAHRG